MAEMVASAFIQEGVSGAVSSVLGRRKDLASQADFMERLEMAVLDLGSVLERTAKLTITDVTLLYKRLKVKLFHQEGADLLNQHKMLQALRSEEEMEQQIGRKRLITCAKNLFVPSSTGLTKYDVKKFERYAAWAEKLVSDVVTGCSLRHHTFCIPLVRYLLEGKTLRYQLMQGSQNRFSIEVRPIHFEDRGVEAVLDYKYEEDARLLGKSFRLILMLRLSESIDIVGIATNCLRALTSHFKLVTRSAMGELTLMPNNLQEVSQSFGYDSTHNIEWHTNGTRRWRPDPLCCTEANGRGPPSTSSVLSHILPEQIIYISFTCYVPALTYSPHSTRDIVAAAPSGRTATSSPPTPPTRSPSSTSSAIPSPPTRCSTPACRSPWSPSTRRTRSR